ncbi:MAG TPA: aldo/keto reductase [Anaerolineales bacterium]|nr:aldo/keto reductase [Anaerolineales bacterium]
MRYVKIAQLEKPVSVIGLGTASRAFTPNTYDRAAELLDRFLEAGGNCIDTAHIYGFGDSEKTLGRWLQESGRRTELVLITKGCHPAVDRQNLFGSPWEPRLTPEAIRVDLSESLERLQTDTIDLYLLHRDDESVPVGPLVEELNQQQSRGHIRAFGASNWRVERIAEANQYVEQHGLNGFVISSPSLSLARPKKMLFPGTLFADEGTRQWHRTNQLPLLAWSALAIGFMSGRFMPDESSDENVTQVYYSEENFERLRRAQELADRKNATVAQIALAFVLGHAFPVIALVGSTTVNTLDDALGALSVELSHEEMEFLDLHVSPLSNRRGLG